MPATLIAQATAASAAPTTTLTATLAAAPAVGDKLLAFVAHSADFPAVPAGWSQDFSSSTTGVLRLFSKTAAAGDGTSYTFTAPTAGGMVVRLLRYSGLGTLLQASGATKPGNTVVMAGFTTTVADVFLLTAAALQATANPTTDITWDNAFTPVATDVKSTGTGTLEDLAVATKTVAATGLQGATASFTPAATTSAQGMMIAYSFAAAALAVTVAATATTTSTNSPVTLTATATGGTGTKTYAWSVLSGPSTAAAQLGTPTAASTTFTPTTVGTYVVRVTVSDTSGTTSIDTSITVTAPNATVTLASVDTATNWAVTGTTALAALSDADGATYLTSATDPAAQLLAGTFAAITPPAAGTPLTVLVDCDKTSATTGSIVAKLLEGATVRSTVNVATIPNGTAGSPVTGQVTIAFPATDIAAITSWAAVKIQLTFTAAP